MKKKQKKRNAGPYQAAVQALFTAQCYKTWDAIEFADQGGATDEYGVMIYRPFARLFFLERFVFSDIASSLGEMVMNKCTTGCSDEELKKLNPGHVQSIYEMVGRLIPYFPFLKACAEKLEMDGKITGTEMKKIFDGMGLSL